MSEISAVKFSIFSEMLQSQLTDLFKWLSDLPHSYFIIAALLSVGIALALRDLWGFLWASLSCLTVLAVMDTKQDLPLIMIVFLTASSLLVVARRIFGTARNRYVLRQLDKLQHRVLMLEGAAQTQFFHSLRGDGTPVATSLVPSHQERKSERATANGPH